MAADYATIEEVKARRGLAQADTAEDAILTQLIEVASRKIDHHCNVTPGAFAAQTQTRFYAATDSHCLKVDNLLSVASSGLETDNGYNNTYSSTWSSGAYRLYPWNASIDGVPYREIRTIATASNCFPVDAYEPRVRVTGSWGYANEVPAEIKEACLLLIARFFARKGSDYGVVGSGEIGTFRISPIDPDVMSLLEPYRERIAR